LLAYLRIALNQKQFVADRKRLAKAIKAGACSVSDLKSATVSTRSTSLQTHTGR
jgi:hypothetical protein